MSTAAEIATLTGPPDEKTFKQDCQAQTLAFEVDLTSKVAELLNSIPGIKTLSELAAIDPGKLAASSRIDYLTALERQTAWLQALMQRAIIAVAGNEPSVANGEEPFFGVDESEREDVSTALRLSAGTAQSRIDVARTLVNYLPNTCSALATGDISLAHANVIAKETAAAIRDGLTEFQIFEVEQRAIAHAEFHTPAQVANQVRTSLARIAPETFEDTVARARDTRRVSCYNNSDGMSTVVAILTAADAQVVINAIESFIRVTSAVNGNTEGSINAKDSRSTDMKRADALTAIAAASLSTSPVTPHRRPISINVTIDLPTLLGLAENPGQLAGYGAIPASVARELASDGKWKRFITDPQTGNLLDYGRESYEPPQALKDFLIARDRTCRFPGCRRSAALSDLDHAQSWEEGGSTSAENLGALCRRHHRLKTHDGWSVTSHADGSCTWVSPLGKKFFTPARSIHDAV